MERNDEVSLGLSRRTVLLASLALAAASAFLAAYIGSVRVEAKKQSVIEELASSSGAWLEGTATSVDAWIAEMREKRRRISESETYSLFASDIFGLDSAAVSRISQSTGTGELGQGMTGTAAVLSEEVPHIRRLLKDYMDHSGFIDARLVNTSGQTLLSAQSMPASLNPAQRDAVASVMKNGRTVALPIYAAASGLVLDVFEPMYGLDSPRELVAVFMSTRPVLADLTQFASRPKPDELAEAAFLQRVPAAGWQAIQPPAPKAVPAEVAAEMNACSGAMPMALRESASGLGAVYSASVPLRGTDWAVVLEVPASSVERRISHATLPIYATYFLGWLAFLLLCQLAWWMAVGRQQKAVNARIRTLHQTVTRQKELLDSVNVSLDIGIFMADVKGRIHVCNRAFAGIAKRSEAELEEQSIFECLPSEAGSELLGRIRQAAIDGGEGYEDSFELWLESDGEKRLFRVSVFPFLDSAEANLRESLRGAVVTLKDITEFRRRSERQRQQQKKLIEAFSSVEASADPYLAGHSRRMAALGELTARSMGLAEDSRNTIVMGAQLSQIGKLFIPRDLLTKSGKLTPEELAEVRKAPEHAARLLEPIGFDLPIVRALYEMCENIDGSGYPQGLSGEQILPEARILAVLNAFCAMVSARSYREGMSEKQALAELASSGKFDMEAVRHLHLVLDTPEGRKALRA